MCLKILDSIVLLSIKNMQIIFSSRDEKEHIWARVINTNIE